MALRRGVLLAAVLLPSCAWVVKSDDLLGGSATALSDGGSIGDSARVEGGGEGGGEAGAACGDKMVCDDFEGAGTIQWRKESTGNGSIVVDTVRPLHGLRSLHASRPAAAGRGTGIFSFFVSSFVRWCELDVYTASTAPDNVSTLSLNFGNVEPPYKSYSVSLEMGGGLSQYAERTSASPLYTGQHVAELGYDRWKHLRIEFEWASASPAIKLYVDGNAIAPFPIVPPRLPPTLMQLGIVYQAVENMGSETFIDDFACLME